jgi:elongation factor 1 alpha-like protein
LGISKDICPSNTINIVVVGHVDSGKSTLVGIFLKEGEMISKKEVHKNEKESK